MIGYVRFTGETLIYEGLGGACVEVEELSDLGGDLIPVKGRRIR